ncbi:MAG: glycosyltransferase [Flavobacteriales bacterium]|nr:glycosyltransferase [Flavobacteriales bacterium]
MKVLILSNMYPSQQVPYSGIFVKNQYERLQELKAPADVIELFYMKRKLTGPTGSAWKYLNAFLRFVPRFFKKYHILHVHYIYPIGLLAYAYKMIHPGCRIVLTVHGSDVSVNLNSKMKRWLFSRVAGMMDYVIAVGDALPPLIRKNLNRATDMVLCAGVDERKFYDEGRDKTIDFLFVGKFVENKGVHLLLEIISRMNDPSVSFGFVGVGKFKEQVEQMAEKQNVTYFGAVDQDGLRKLYSASRFLVLPAEKEGFGLVVSEAMFCGTPVIATRVGGIAGQIKDGFNGFFIGDRTVEGIEKCLKKAVEMAPNEYSHMAENALKSNRQYALQHVCIEVMKVYQVLSNQTQ